MVDTTRAKQYLLQAHTVLSGLLNQALYAGVEYLDKIDDEQLAAAAGSPDDDESEGELSTDEKLEWLAANGGPGVAAAARRIKDQEGGFKNGPFGAVIEGVIDGAYREERERLSGGSDVSSSNWKEVTDTVETTTEDKPFPEGTLLPPVEYWIKRVRERRNAES